MYKKIIIAFVLIVGMFSVGSSVYAERVGGVEITPSQQTLSYANGTHTGSLLVMVSNPNRTNMCVTVPKSFSLGGRTVTVGRNIISGTASLNPFNDSQICGQTNYTVQVTISVGSGGTTLTEGNYTYTVNSATYGNLEATITVPVLRYSIRNYVLPQFGPHVYEKCNAALSKPYLTSGVPDYAQYCSLANTLVNNNNPKSLSNYNSIFVEGSFSNVSGDYVADALLSNFGTWTGYLSNYRAVVGSGVRRTFIAIDTVTHEEKIVSEVYITPAGNIDFSHTSEVTVYHPIIMPQDSFTLTPATQSTTITAPQSSETKSLSFNISNRNSWVECSDVNLSAQQADTSVLGNYVTNFTQGDRIHNACAPTLSFTVNPSYVSQKTIWVCPEGSTAVDENGVSFVGREVPQNFVCGGTQPNTPKPTSVVQKTISTTHYLKDENFTGATVHYKAIGQTSDGEQSLGASRSVDFSLNFVPGAAQTTSLALVPEKTSDSFSGGSKGTSKSIAVSVNTTGYSNAKANVTTPDSQLDPSLAKYITAKYKLDNLGKIERTGSDNFSQTLIITRRSDSPTITTTATGTITLNATGPDGKTASAIIVIILYPDPASTTASLSLTPSSCIGSCTATATLTTTLSNPTMYLFSPGNGKDYQLATTNSAVLPYDSVTTTTSYTVIGIAINSSGASSFATATMMIYPEVTSEGPSFSLSPLVQLKSVSSSALPTTTSFSVTATNLRNMTCDQIQYTDTFTDTNPSSRTVSSATVGCVHTITIPLSASASGSYQGVTTAVATGVAASAGTKLAGYGITITNTVINTALSAALHLSQTSAQTNESITASVSGTGGSTLYTAYSINFGDGSNTVNSSLASHAYASAGIYTVTGTVTDTNGTRATDSKIVTITTGTPVVEPLSKIQAGISVTPERLITPDKAVIAVSASGGRGAGTYKYTIDFGDGSSPVVYTNAGSSVSNISHTYTTVNAKTVYQLQVTVDDMNSAYASLSGSASVSLTAYAPLVCTLSMNKSIGLPPFHPTFIVKTVGGTESKYDVRINADGGTKATDQKYVSNPATASTTLDQYVYLKSGSYAPMARIFDLDLIGNGSLAGTKNASTTCATSATVLSGSGGEANPGQ